MLTVKLKWKGNMEVLAKEYQGQLFPVTYANRKQAYEKKAKLLAQGVQCDVYIGSGRGLLIGIEPALDFQI